MKTLFALLIVVMSGAAGFAAEIRKGAMMHVKPNAIWFEDADRLARWQTLKAGGDTQALASYQREALSAREAWQFSGRLAVTVLGIDRGGKKVHVEMKTPGRMQGTHWFLDTEVILR